MKVLILGSGGREHALAWAVKRSEQVTEVVCAPGNGGIGQVARCVPVDLKSLDAMVAVAEAEKPGLIIVGPELPLSLGVVDALQERGFRVFGPTKAAAMLESSKGFAKRFLQRHNIPTGNYAVCSSAEEVDSAIDLFHAPIVVKADGLAAGKGVLICQSRNAAIEAAHGLFTGSLLGEASKQVVIEEFLEGDEISFLCLTDGKHVVPLAPAQDHKRIGDGDIGPNTGGMGVYSTDEMLDPAMKEWIMRHIAVPTVYGMASEDTPFVGVLYCGLMMTARGPQVLEFNARFGDPETQVVLARLHTPLAGLLLAVATGKLDLVEPLRWDDVAAVTVVIAAAGYPSSPRSGDPIEGLGAADSVEGAYVLHAGTAETSTGSIVSSGGRVLSVTATGVDLTQARDRAYEAVARIRLDGSHHRSDIALTAALPAR
jgi:phosphoribosylamine---glycine ligase